MFDWITHNKGLFLNSYTEIGTSHPHAMELQTQHNHFAMNCMVRFCLSQHVPQGKVFEQTGRIYTEHMQLGGHVGPSVTDWVVAADLQV